MAVSKKDLAIALGIFLLALSLRLPFVGYPDKVMFDEGLNASFALRVAERVPYFDIHPPLMPMINAPAFENTVPKSASFDIPYARPFPSHIPYVRMRSMAAAAGSLLVAVIFLLAKAIYKKNTHALIAAGLVLFDNALVVYSRVILPDTYLLLFGFAGVLFSIYAGVSEKKWPRYVCLLLAGIFLGLSASVKWTGLGFSGAAAFFFLRQRQWRPVLFICPVIAFTYIAITVAFFANFPVIPDEIAKPAMESPGKALEKTFLDIKYPALGIGNTLMYIPQHLKNMFRANEYWEGGWHTTATRPYQWPLGTALLFYMSGQNTRIELRHNFIGLFSALTAFLAASLLLLLKKRAAPAGFDYFWMQFLITAALMQYIPLFFIGRALFMYHYFAALVFGYLLIPSVLLFFLGALPIYWQKRALLIFWCCVFAGFLILAPSTYGIALR